MSLPTDSHDVYFADHDDVIKCTENDPEAADPAEWPEWTDLYIYEPTPNDIEFLGRNAYGDEPFEPSDEDWDDLYRATYGDHITDEDIQNNGLAVG